MARLDLGVCDRHRNVVLTLAGIAEGTNLAGAAIASVLLNTAPFLAALFARVWLDERHAHDLLLAHATVGDRLGDCAEEVFAWLFAPLPQRCR